jgi:predicted nucleic-acid-binding protein
MRSLDTNVVLRGILGDDPNQTVPARAALGQPAFLSASVLAELFWVLTSNYNYDRTAACNTVQSIIDIPTIATMPGVDWALEHARAGADFADAIHVLASSNAEAFLTFDRALHRRLGPTAPVAVELLDA